MLSFLNKKLKFLLIVILAVIGISFIFFGQWTPHGPSGSSDTIAKIDGQNIKLKDLFNAIQASRVIYTLQTGQLPPDGSQADEIFRVQTWNRLLVLAAAKKAGISVGEDEAYDFIVKHPLFFDKDGKFSDEAYKNFQQRILQSLGIDQKRFISIVRELLVYQQAVQNVASTAVVQPSAVQEAIDQLYSKISVQYVEVSEDSIRKGLKPSDQELLTFYNANSAEYSAPETRVVEYVKFQLDPKQAALKDSERSAALRELSKKAYEFTNAFFSAYDTKTPLPDFTAAAKKAGLQVQSTAPFSHNDSIIDNENSKHLIASAFTLSSDTPVSDYLPVSDGFVVLHLLKVSPSQPKAFQAVRDEVLKKYNDFVASSRLLEQSKAVAINLRASLKDGKTLAQAAAAQGLKVQSLPDIIPAETQPDAKNPLLERAAYAVRLLQPGTLSEPVRSPNGAALIYVASRTKPDAAQVAKVEKAIRDQVEQMRRQQIVGEWINSLLASPKTNIPQEALTGRSSARS